MAEEPKPKTYQAQVESVSWTGDKGEAVIILDNQARRAFIPTTCKNVRAGDMVEVEKKATWVIKTVITPHAIPAVSVSMGTKPPSASTATGSTPTASGTPRKVTASLPSPVSTPPGPPNSNIGTTLASLQTWATNTRAYLHNLNDNWIEEQHSQISSLRALVWTIIGVLNDNADVLSNVRSAVNTNATTLSSTQQALNSNASKLNQAVDYAEGAADAMMPVVEALKDERIVK